MLADLDRAAGRRDQERLDVEPFEAVQPYPCCVSTASTSTCQPAQISSSDMPRMSRW